MGAPATLFDMDPFTERQSGSAGPRKRHSMRPDVWAALQHLKAVMDSVPAEEMARREQAYRSMTGGVR